MGAQNLVQNPGFESWTDGKPDSWGVTAIQISQSSEFAHSGTYSIGLIGPASGSNSIGANDIPVVAGKVYVYSGWYLDNGSNARFRYWGQWRTDSALLNDAGLQGATYSTDSPQWVKFSVEATAPATATVARLSLRTYAENSAGGSYIYFDDISFADKELAVTDVTSFDKQIKMNTNVGNELTVILPARATVNIYTAEGKLVSSNRINSGESINTSSLTKGMYIVTVDNGSAKVSRKVMKN